MMTVQEEVSRAVQIASASAPQELVTRSLVTDQKIANGSASNAQEVSRASIPSISLPLTNSSSPETAVLATRSAIVDLVRMPTKLLKWSAFHTKGLIFFIMKEEWQ